jgi:hypothetical protein
MKQHFNFLKMRFLLTLFSFVLVFNAFAQHTVDNVLSLDDYYITIDGRGTVPKKTIDSLIGLHNSTLINDTARVAIIYQLGEYRCVQCVEFLLNNLTRSYYYGDNYSFDDIACKEAAYTALNIITRDTDYAWYLFPHLLYSLKQQRSESPLYYHQLTRLLSAFTDRKMLKSIIDTEISRDALKKREPFTRSIYHDNLKLILKDLDTY